MKVGYRARNVATLIQDYEGRAGTKSEDFSHDNSDIADVLAETLPFHGVGLEGRTGRGFPPQQSDQQASTGRARCSRVTIVGR